DCVASKYSRSRTDPIEPVFSCTEATELLFMMPAFTIAAGSSIGGGFASANGLMTTRNGTGIPGFIRLVSFLCRGYFFRYVGFATRHTGNWSPNALFLELKKKPRNIWRCSRNRPVAQRLAVCAIGTGLEITCWQRNPRNGGANGDGRILDACCNRTACGGLCVRSESSDTQSGVWTRSC